MKAQFRILRASVKIFSQPRQKRSIGNQSLIRSVNLLLLFAWSCLNSKRKKVSLFPQKEMVKYFSKSDTFRPYHLFSQFNIVRDGTVYKVGAYYAALTLTRSRERKNTPQRVAVLLRSHFARRGDHSCEASVLTLFPLHQTSFIFSSTTLCHLFFSFLVFIDHFFAIYVCGVLCAYRIS